MAKKSNKIRRICLYGGPGSGKSKLACYLNYMLMDYDIDLVSEYIKAWAYEGKIPESLDQWYVYGKQTHEEDRLLRTSRKTKKPIVDLIVTDSPLYLQCCYSKMFNVPGTEQALEKTHLFEKMYPSLNIFVDRPAVYRTGGRYQSKKQAIAMDNYIVKNLEEWKIPYFRENVVNTDKIIKTIRDTLGRPEDR
jgi:hypothetical protein